MALQVEDSWCVALRVFSWSTLGQFPVVMNDYSIVPNRGPRILDFFPIVMFIPGSCEVDVIGLP